jgi:hypothetical protein
MQLLGLAIDLVDGGYTATGEIFEQPVALTIDFAADPAQVGVSSGTGTFVVSASSSPTEVTLTLPVELGLLVVGSPLYVPLRLAGAIVLRAPVCAGACAAACDDGTDNDGDAEADYGDDLGCSSALDVSEHNVGRVCDDGFDNDGDGLLDFDAAGGAGDPACISVASGREDSRCQDGIDNDGERGTDFDAGESILGIGHGDPDGPDPQCVGKPERDREGSADGCGLGSELLFLFAAAAGRRRRTATR